MPRLNLWTLVCPIASLLCASPSDAVDGVIELNQASALRGNVTPGDAPGLPITISQSGSYRLTGHLDVGDADTNVIDAGSTPDVTIDLNGFSIRGPVFCPGEIPQCDASGTGVGVWSNAGFLTVRNGTIIGMGSHAIFTSGGSLIEDLTIKHCASGGIRAGPLSIVRGSRISNLEGSGVQISFRGGLVVDNTIFRAGSFGISMASGGLPAVLNNSGYGRNVLEFNNGGSGQPQVEGGVQIAPNICDGDTVCP